ncbi:hypothetical protein THAOC_07833, partial [Thalassiosira oceanica]
MPKKKKSSQSAKKKKKKDVDGDPSQPAASLAPDGVTSPSPDDVVLPPATPMTSNTAGIDVDLILQQNALGNVHDGAPAISVITPLKNAPHFEDDEDELSSRDTASRLTSTEQDVTFLKTDIQDLHNLNEEARAKTEAFVANSISEAQTKTKADFAQQLSEERIKTNERFDQKLSEERIKMNEHFAQIISEALKNLVTHRIDTVDSRLNRLETALENKADDTVVTQTLSTVATANGEIEELTKQVTTLSSKVGVLESDEKVRIRNSVNFQNIKPVVFEVFNKDFAPACKKHADDILSDLVSRTDVRINSAVSKAKEDTTKELSSDLDRIKEQTTAAKTVASDLETTRSDAEALLAKFHAAQLGSALSDLDDLQARDAADDDFDARSNTRPLRRSGAGGDDAGHGGGDDGDGDGGGDSGNGPTPSAIPP